MRAAITSAKLRSVQTVQNKHSHICMCITCADIEYQLFKRGLGERLAIQRQEIIGDMSTPFGPKSIRQQNTVQTHFNVTFLSVCVLMCGYVFVCVNKKKYSGSLSWLIVSVILSKAVDQQSADLKQNQRVVVRRNHQQMAALQHKSVSVLYMCYSMLCLKPIQRHI